LTPPIPLNPGAPGNEHAWESKKGCPCRVVKELEKEADWLVLSIPRPISGPPGLKALKSKKKKRDSVNGVAFVFVSNSVPIRLIDDVSLLLVNA
jgi:hypothetical protein